MTEYEKSINKFTGSLISTLQIHNISLNEFSIDFNNMKKKSMNYVDFKRKYNEMFDGTFHKFKNKASFIGSYNRSINPKLYNQLKNQNVANYNRNLRIKTIQETPLQQKIDKEVNKVIKSKFISNQFEFESSKTYKGFGKNEIANLENVWNLAKVRENRLVGYQEIQFKINYDLIDEYNRIIYADQWITVRSGISKVDSLNECYNKAYQEYINFYLSTEQSKLYISIKNINCYVVRVAN